MLPPLTLNKEQRIKLIELITLLNPWEFKKWNEVDIEEVTLDITYSLLCIVNMETHEELWFHWYELLTTYLLLDLVNKYYNSDEIRPFENIIEEMNNHRLHLNEPIHPVDTIYNHFKQFIIH